MSAADHLLAESVGKGRESARRSRVVTQESSNVRGETTVTVIGRSIVQRGSLKIVKCLLEGFLVGIASGHPNPNPPDRVVFKNSILLR